jgi:hypothetical protein
LTTKTVIIVVIIIMGRRGFSEELAKKNGLALDRYPLTKQEIQQAEDALAADLEGLSLLDQEKLVFDIYGLAIDDREQDHSKLEEALKAIEDELQKIDADKKSAYNQALSMNTEYVQVRDFRLLFLRCAEYDPSLAADQIVQHFESKRKLFGTGDVLCRPVLLADLTETAIKYLEVGGCQILPSRDAAGRVVMFMAPAYTNQYENMDDLVSR